MSDRLALAMHNSAVLRSERRCSVIVGGFIVF